MPSEITALENLECLVKYPEGFPIAKQNPLLWTKLKRLSSILPAIQLKYRERNIGNGHGIIQHTKGLPPPRSHSPHLFYHTYLGFKLRV